MKIIYIPKKRLTAELPTVSISDPYDIGTTTFSCGGNILSNGGSPLTAKGFVWGTSPNPTLANNIANAGNTNVTGFDIFFQYLSTNTTYYLRAFATNGVGTAYSTQKQVDTLAVVGLPAVFNITTGVPTTSSVRVIGEVTGTGGGTITQQGVCYNTTGNPSTSDPKILWTPNGIGMMDMDVTGLTTNTTYYFRFFATNQAGTAYSPSFTVVTSNIVQLCTVETGIVSEITRSTAEVHGRITSYGGGSLQEAGFCYSTSPNPTTANSKKIVTGSTIGTDFFTTLSGLQENTKYYVRTYAINEAGTAYGTTAEFTTTIWDLIFYLDFEYTANVQVLIDCNSSGIVKGVFHDGSEFPAASQYAYTGTSSGVGRFSLYAAGACLVTLIKYANCKAFGLSDLKHQALTELTDLTLSGQGGNNDNITSLTLPAVLNNTVNRIMYEYQNTSGELDLSAVKYVDGNSSVFAITNCPNITKVKLSTSLSGGFLYFAAYTCNITGVLDISMVSGFSVGLLLGRNPLLTSILLAGTLSENPYSLDLSFVPNLVDFQLIKILNTLLSTKNYNINLYSNSLSAAKVNQMLVQLDSIAQARPSMGTYPSSTSHIELRGNNAAPDASSGGFNGTAAKASLTAKNYTVLTN